MRKIFGSGHGGAGGALQQRSARLAN